MLEWWTKNFASCELGDERLDNRAFSIGKKLSQGFGKALSEVFKEGREGSSHSCVEKCIIHYTEAGGAVCG